MVDLTVDEAPSPKTSTANTSVNIYNVLAKRQKRGTDSRSKLIGSSLRKPRTDTRSELEHTRDDNIGINKEAPDFEVVRSSGDDNSDIRENRAPAVVVNGNSSVNDDAIQEVDSMETSGSQRPKLSRFQRFTQRKANGFISARITRAVSWSSCGKHIIDMWCGLRMDWLLNNVMMMVPAYLLLLLYSVSMYHWWSIVQQL